MIDKISLRLENDGWIGKNSEKTPEARALAWLFSIERLQRSKLSF